MVVGLIAILLIYLVPLNDTVRFIIRSLAIILLSEMSLLILFGPKVYFLSSLHPSPYCAFSNFFFNSVLLQILIPIQVMEVLRHPNPQKTSGSGTALVALTDVPSFGMSSVNLKETGEIVPPRLRLKATILNSGRNTSSYNDGTEKHNSDSDSETVSVHSQQSAPRTPKISATNISELGGEIFRVLRNSKSNARRDGVSKSNARRDFVSKSNARHDVAEIEAPEHVQPSSTGGGGFFSKLFRKSDKTASRSRGRIDDHSVRRDWDRATFSNIRRDVDIPVEIIPMRNEHDNDPDNYNGESEKRQKHRTRREVPDTASFSNARREADLEPNGKSKGRREGESKSNARREFASSNNTDIHDNIHRDGDSAAYPQPGKSRERRNGDSGYRRDLDSNSSERSILDSKSNTRRELDSRERVDDFASDSIFVRKSDSKSLPSFSTQSRSVNRTRRLSAAPPRSDFFSDADDKPSRKEKDGKNGEVRRSQSRRFPTSVSSPEVEVLILEHEDSS